MITHKLIQQETEELKQTLKKEEIVIPSFWKCCWPGLVYMIFMNCWYCISMKFNIDDKLSFITVCSFIIFLGVSGARSTYLCIPNIFLTHSKCYKFLSKKIKTYLSIHVVILIIAGIWCLFLGKNTADTIFVCAFFPSLIVLFAIFCIDISRYQLSAFVAIIEQFKDQHKKESA